MPADLPSSRRDFLSGQAALEKVRAAAGRRLEGGDGPRDFEVGPTIRLETRAMGCSWQIVMNPGPPEQVMWASDAFQEVHRVESQLSIYRDDSDVARLNAGTASGPLDQDLYRFLKWTEDLGEATDGYYEPVCLALTRLWRDCRLANRIPTEDEVAQALALCGSAYVRFDDDTRSIHFPSLGFGYDLGASGKGYGIDRAVSALRASGGENFLIHGGYSSVFAAGDHNGQAGWPVALKNPLFLDDSYAVVRLRNAGLGTSGSNVQYFRYEGKRYGHILDPLTGWPADDLLSVTVIAPTAAEADAVSTALYVMGLELARIWCQDHPQVGAILVPPPDAAGRLDPIVCNLPESAVTFLDDSVRDSTSTQRPY
jgi:thiamine biosynthesis lipoprotein